VFGNAVKKVSNDPTRVIETLVNFSEKARREGILSLEKDAKALDDEFLQKGIQLVVDGASPELVRDVMTTELEFLESRHTHGQSIFGTAGSLAPAFGLIGTLIGLVFMLNSLDNVENIGPAMAVALLTTLYGAFLANTFFIPITVKLKVNSADENLLRNIAIEGVLAIQAGESPRIVRQKLRAFFSAGMRAQMDKMEGAAAA